MFKRPQLVAFLALPFFALPVAGWIMLVIAYFIALPGMEVEVRQQVLMIFGATSLFFPAILAGAMYLTPYGRYLWKKGL